MIFHRFILYLQTQLNIYTFVNFPPSFSIISETVKNESRNENIDKHIFRAAANGKEGSVSGSVLHGILCKLS